LTGQYDIVNNIAGDERLRKGKEGSEKDEEKAQYTPPPVPVEIRAQVLEVGFYARISLLTSDPVPGELPGKPRLQICEPILHNYKIYIIFYRGSNLYY